MITVEEAEKEYYKKCDETYVQTACFIAGIIEIIILLMVLHNYNIIRFS